MKKLNQLIRCFYPEGNQLECVAVIAVTEEDEHQITKRVLVRTSTVDSLMSEFDQQEDGNYFSSGDLLPDHTVASHLEKWLDCFREASKFASQYIVDNKL